MGAIMSAFSDKLAELGFASYEAYLAGEHWQQFKAEYKGSGRSMRCAVCDTKPIQLHHHTYVRLGCEQLSDVTPLCRSHHIEVHEYLKASGLIYVEQTHKAVELLRAAEGKVALYTKPKPKDKPTKSNNKKRRKPESAKKLRIRQERQARKAEFNRIMSLEPADRDEVLRLQAKVNHNSPNNLITFERFMSEDKYWEAFCLVESFKQTRARNGKKRMRKKRAKLTKKLAFTRILR